VGEVLGKGDWIVESSDLMIKWSCGKPYSYSITRSPAHPMLKGS